MSRIGELHLETETVVIPTAGDQVTKGDAVKLITGGPNYASLSTAATDLFLGVALHDCDDTGEVLTVVRRGRVLANGAENTAIAIGDMVAPGAGGKFVVVSAASAPYWGIARSATTGTGFEEFLVDLLYGGPCYTPAA